jgi:tetratricopeptide (TPR) repeat protein
VTAEPTPLVDLSDAAFARVRLDEEITRAWEDIDSLLFLTHTAMAARQADLAVRASERAVELVRNDGTPEDLLVALLAAGTARMAVSDHTVALGLIRKARSIAEERVDEQSAALARLKLAQCFAALRQPEVAREHLDAAVPVLDAMGDSQLALEIENVRACVAGADDDHVTAFEIRQKIADANPSRSDVDGARLKIRTAAAAHNGGDRARARALLTDAIGVLERANDKAGIAYALEGLGVIERQEGRPEAALSLYERGIALARDVGENGRAARFVVLSGYCMVHLGRFRDAAAVFAEAADLFNKRSEVYEEADACMSAGIAYRNLGETDEATRQYTKAADLFRSVDIDQKADDCEKEIVKLRKKPTA